VIVLSFIVLISIVLLSYLASTQLSLRKSSSSAAIVQTDILAQAASASIVDDIRQEMLAGADGALVPTNNQPMSVTNAWAMVPGRVISSGIGSSDPIYLNLVKQSLRSRSFYPGDNSNLATFTAKGLANVTGFHRASAVSTADASLNGRIISTNRWNKPLLLTGLGFTNNAQLPDWILISRKGPATNGDLAALGAYTNKTANNTSYVIGRYAYNIYDVGGLLDINVAGFPASAANSASKKGSTAWADLLAIPGVTDADKVVAWRNKESQSDYLAMVQGRQIMTSNIWTNNWGEPGGFQRAYNTNGAADNRFFLRQDLIKYALTYSNAGLTTNALPFLTTFSADLDRPSFVPDANRPMVSYPNNKVGNDAYLLDNTNNPSFLAVTGTNTAPITKRRFPLDRLKYIAANDSDKITKYFGLTWNPTDHCWDYKEDRIRPLSEVSGEPNFFELLKAAISSGSLGGQFPLVEDPGDSPLFLTANGSRYGSVNYQIFQIGANIIDQYDADSNPTRIRWISNGVPFWAYGKEDIPYLFDVRIAPYRQQLVTEGELRLDKIKKPPTGGARDFPYRSVVMLQPTVWNPHAPSTMPYDGPSQFRITADGDVIPKGNLGWWATTEWSPNKNVAVYPSSNPKDNNQTVTFDPDKDYINFNASRDNASPTSFREPYTLKSPDYPAGSGAVGFAASRVPDNKGDGVTFETPDPSDPLASGEGSNRVIGFRAGWVWAGPGNNASGVNGAYFLNAVTEGETTYELQYLDAKSGTYLTYDTMEGVPPFDGNINVDTYASITSKFNQRFRAWARLDPRSNRYGYRNFLFGVSDWPLGETYRPGPAAANGLQGVCHILAANLPNSHWNWPVAGTSTTVTTYWGAPSENKASSSINYADPDNVRRLAMGGLSSSTGTGLPLVTGNNSSRPVILNRPFRSVAELGYAFRDAPWKQIDFWTPESGDAALLDVFCISESATEDADPIVSGRVNLNTKRPEVLEALIRGAAAAAETNNSVDGLTAAEAKSVSTNLVAWTTNQSSTMGPLRNRSELVGKFLNATNYSGFSTNYFPANSSVTSDLNKFVSFRRESVMRALVDGGTTRTWTFLVDLVVQSGRYPENSSALDKFVVEGEQRYWVQIAIDRYTGKVTSQFVEAVNE